MAGGTPTLTLNDGGIATYSGGSGTSALTFSYTVGAGQNTAALTATAVNLNAATITDGAGNAANLSLSGLTQTGPQIDTTAPSVSSLVTSGTGISSGAGDLDAGKTVTLTINLSEAVTVAGGTPTLTLNDGGTATYSGGSGSSALTFSYTVGAGQNTSDLTVTAVNLNSATVTDGAGNAANLTGAVTNPAGILQIDTTTPSVSSVVTSGTGISSGAGDLDAGRTVTLTINLSEAVTVAGGTPTLTLNDGGTATYTGGSGTSALTFSYTVGAGQNTPDLTVTAVNLNAATVTDGAGNAANLIGAVTNPAGILQIDTTTPSVSSVVTSGTGISSGAGDLDAGKTVTLTINLTEAVTVAGGTPTLTLNDGGTATYTGGSGTSALTFSYTVGAGQNTSDLTVTAVNLNAATVTDGAGNAASLIGAVINPAGILQIDTTTPVIASLVESSSSGDLDAGKTVTLTLNLGEVVTVAGGTPTLTLNDGGIATYSGGSGTSALTFSYTVGAGQNTAALAATAVNLNAATITDGAGNTANLSLSGLTQTGPQIDTTAPVISSITETPSSGDLNAGKTVAYTITMSEVVTVNTTGGTPTLSLNDGGTATYVSGSGTNALTFSYTVLTGQNTPDLMVAAVNLNGAAVQDGAGNSANLSLTGLTQGSPQIDTTTPTIASVVESSSSGDLDAGKIVTLTINLSEAVTVAGGTPTLTLNDGGTATYSGGSGTSALTFSYTVGAGQNTSALAATAVNLNAATIADGAGNVANLSLTGLTQTGPQIDTTAPLAPTIMTFSPNSGSAGSDVTNATVLTLTGTAIANGTVEVFDGSTELGTATTNSSGVWTYTTGALANGSHSFAAADIDAAGNVSTASTALNVTVNTVAPTAPVITTGTNDGNGSVTLSGAAPANSTVEVFTETMLVRPLLMGGNIETSTLLGTTTANANGSWNYTTSTLANGSHGFTVESIDAAGNVSAASAALNVTVALVASAVPTITSFSPDSGVVGDGITNATVLTLTGVAVANSTVALFDGSTELGTTTANSSGAWSYTTGTLANGSHSFTATDTVSGNVSTASTALNVTVDTVAPAAPSITSFSPDSGVVGDGITNATVLTLTGTAVANSTIELFDGATELGTTTANGSGVWSYTTGTLANGVQSFTAKAVDAAGNVSAASTALNVTVDTVAPAAPTITAFSPDTGVVGDDITSATVLTLTGTAVANSTIELFDGATEIGTTTANGSGAWSYTTGTLANGIQSFTAKAVDAAGNVSTASAALNVTVDTVAPAAPTITAFSPDSGVVGDGITNATVLTLTGTAVAKSTIELFDGATEIGTTTANGSGAWSYTTGTLANGIQSFTAKAADAAGNVSAASIALTVTVDTVAPAAPVIAGDTINSNNSVTLSGTAAANATITLYDGATDLGTTTANGSGAWTYTTGALTAGSQAFTATATDVAGNVSAVSNGVDPVISAAAPTITSFSPDSGVVGDGITNATVLTLTGVAVAHSTVALFDGSTELGTTTANGSGAWSYTTGTLANGSHSFTATDTVSGNVSTASTALNVTVDTVAPAAPTIIAFSPDSGVVGDDITSATVLTLTGTAVANSTIELFDGATELGTTTANGSGAWSYSTGTLANGIQSFTAKAVDAAGNVSTASTALNVTVDTVAPAAPIITAFSPDSGVVGDDITSATVLTLTGTAAANSTIELFDGATELGTTTANGSGAWSYTTGTLANGIQSFTAKAVDASGNVSTASTALNVTVDTVAPAAPTITAFSPDTGVVGDDITSAKVLTLTGTAVANSTIELFDGSTELGTTTANGSGAWSYTTGTLANGVQSFTAKAVDAAGNVSTASTALNVTVDTVAPAAPAIAGDTINSNNSVTLSGTAAADSTVTLYDGATDLGTTTANGSGAWTYTTGPLTAGSQPFTATATDVAGVVSPGSPATTVTITSITPAVPPVPVIASDTVNGNTVTLTGTAEADTTVSIYSQRSLLSARVDLGTAQTNAGGTWSFVTGALASGSYTFYATATNATGNTSALSAGLDPTVGQPAAASATAASLTATDTLALDQASPANGAFPNGSASDRGLDLPSPFAGTVAGLGGPNTSNLPGSHLANSNQTGGTLLLADGRQSASIALLGHYMASSFARSGDSHGNSMVVAAAAQNPRPALLTTPHHA